MKSKAAKEQAQEKRRPLAFVDLSVLGCFAHQNLRSIDNDLFSGLCFLLCRSTARGTELAVELRSAFSTKHNLTSFILQPEQQSEQVANKYYTQGGDSDCQPLDYPFEIGRASVLFCE